MGRYLSGPRLRHHRWTLLSGGKVTPLKRYRTDAWPGKWLPTGATCRHLPEKWYRFQNILVYLQHDSRNERFEDMINGTFKYPEIRFFGYLPKRIPEPSETRFSDNSVTYGFNDFMTQCRHSLLICYITSALNLMGVNQPICVITETEDAVHMETKN